jgi:hypothetical protein
MFKWTGPRVVRFAAHAHFPRAGLSVLRESKSFGDELPRNAFTGARVRVASQAQRQEDAPDGNREVTSGSVVALPEERRHVWCARLSNRFSKGSGCPFCSGNRVSATNSLASQFPSLSGEWDRARNGRLTPGKVAAKSHLSVWWRCRRDEAHLWKARIDDRTHHEAGCPICEGKAAVPPGAREGRLNALADRSPDLVLEWDRERNAATTPAAVSCGSHFKAWWRCRRNRTHRWQAAIYDRSRGKGCPYCAGKRRPGPSTVIV